MKGSSAIHRLAALAVFLVWVAAIVAMMVNPEVWSEAIPYVLLCSVATIAGTVLISRYWIRRKSVPSYGCILLVPFACVFLLGIGTLLWDAIRYGEWELFTWSYWQDQKGGIAGLIIPFAVFWFVCLFPATAIVLYFQKPNDSEKTQAA